MANENNKTPVNLSINTDVWECFQVFCQASKDKPSNIIENFMRDIVNMSAPLKKDDPKQNTAVKTNDEEKLTR